MQTNTPSESELRALYKPSFLSNLVLEDIAESISEQPDFPLKTDPRLINAFSSACFYLIVRHGNGEYDGFTQNDKAKHFGRLYLNLFATDEYMKSSMEEVVGKELAGEEKPHLELVAA